MQVYVSRINALGMDGSGQNADICIYWIEFRCKLTSTDCWAWTATYAAKRKYNWNPGMTVSGRFCWKTQNSKKALFQSKVITFKSAIQISWMRQRDDLRQELMDFLWSLMPQITKPVIEAENLLLPSETKFFNTIGRKQIQGLILNKFPLKDWILSCHSITDTESPGLKCNLLLVATWKRAETWERNRSFSRQSPRLLRTVIAVLAWLSTPGKFWCVAKSWHSGIAISAGCAMRIKRCVKSLTVKNISSLQRLMILNHSRKSKP